jgi:hypothetical protein
VDAFADLQARLPEVWALNVPGSTVPHVSVVMPAFAMGEALLSHYATRLGAMEHRYLLATLMIPRIPGVEVVFISCEEPGREVLEYYARLASPARPEALLERLHVVSVPDRTARPVSAKLLDRPDRLALVRELIGGRPAMLESWNVTATEVEVALALGTPVNGTDPELWPLAFKSRGRRLFTELGVPVPAGCEDVCDLAGVGAAVTSIRSTRPQVTDVVVKHDNSGGGDGNLIVPLVDGAGHRLPPADVVAGLTDTVPQWFVDDLTRGGIVEELVSGAQVRSPSAQLEVVPQGGSRVLSTHEQILGGENGQVYSGCRFPADPAYASTLVDYGTRVADRLGELGALGRVGVDYIATLRPGGWDVLALEVNLRKGGTTHPFTALRHLVPGHYDAASGQYVGDGGAVRCYRSTDGMLDPAWTGVAPAQVIDAVAAAGLEFDARSRSGVVLHMLSCLKVDGRLGVTAIAATHEEADDLYAATARVVASLA